MKLLTSHAQGLNNNTRVKIDSYAFRFGYESLGVAEFDHVKPKSKELWKNKKVVEGKTEKWVTKMTFKEAKINVTQEVSIVMGQNTRLLDTALVKYIIKNNDSRVHTVGIRLMLDTFIGASDGVPFEVGPTDSVAGTTMVDTKATYTKQDKGIPQYLRALEDPNDLAGKNTTIAVMGLKLNMRNIEPLSKVVLCRWPAEKGGSQADWDWDFEAINAKPDNPDSCVVLYWETFNSPPGEERVCAFTYGLDRIAGEKSDSGGGESKYTSQMRLFARPSKVDKDFVVTAYIKDADDNNVTLSVPSEIELKDTATKTVKTEPGKKIATVSWKVRGKKIGDYSLKAVLNDDKKTTAQEPVSITKGSIFD
jgi:hypothetical protein